MNDLKPCLSALALIIQLSVVVSAQGTAYGE